MDKHTFIFKAAKDPNGKHIAVFLYSRKGDSSTAPLLGILRMLPEEWERLQELLQGDDNVAHELKVT